MEGAIDGDLWPERTEWQVPLGQALTRGKQGQDAVSRCLGGESWALS